MCCFCLSRRSLLVAPAFLSWTSAGTAQVLDMPIEPRMRLADPPSDRLVVVLTLDACPGDFDERIATALVESGIAATIFVTDLWMRRNPVGLAYLLAHRDLFDIENHGELHIPPVIGKGRIYGIPVAGDLVTVRREVVQGANAISMATGTPPHWYRGATGYYSLSAMPEIEQAGFSIAGYSLNADAGASLPAHSVAARMAMATNGEIIVAHINQPNRPSGWGVVAGVRNLQHRGASFRRFDQLATRDIDYAANGQSIAT
jgi:peptidoglycan/xylan/chitin deacetylase (PgdA/CDA1 family)